ncbi:endolytic transglycosylase MltG [Cardiobacteriaceae bacterium TAE3-ERU3]|nr:endolytic transglycosylase MltG [Cardiobacteriaceae bacterium TAE3-ERU3]
MFGKIFRRLFILLLIIGIGIAALGYWQYCQVMDAHLAPSVHGGTIIHVANGSNLKQIANELESRGIIQQAWPLRIYGRLRGDAGLLKAGDYRLKMQDTPAELYQSMVEGDVITHSITIVEGTTYADLRRKLREAEDLTQTLDGVTDEELAKKLGIEAGHLEGQFLPETYFYTANDSDFTILKRLHNKLEQALNQAWENRDPEISIKTPYEALILASIIEKETQLANERALVSGVFNRRLKKGMRLQTDPTVIYGIVNYNGNITRTHLTTDTPYNTYTRHGLPPTPIALPSQAAIEAAVHPDSGKSLFFVADGRGGHVFSETYATHKKAVQNLIRIQREKKAKQ